MLKLYMSSVKGLEPQPGEEFPRIPESLLQSHNDSDFHKLELAMEELNLTNERLQSLFNTLAPNTLYRENEVALTVTLANGLLDHFDLSVEQSQLFVPVDGGYEVSMEGMEVTLAEVVKFALKAIGILVDAAARYFGRRLTFVGQAHQTARDYNKILKKLTQVNVTEMAGIEVEYNGAALNLVDKWDGKGADVLTPDSVRALTSTLADALGPQNYRMSLEALIGIVRGFDGVADEDFIDSFQQARKAVGVAMVRYMSITDRKTHGYDQVGESEMFPGFMRYTISFHKNEFKAPEIALVKRRPPDLEFFVDQPITVTQAMLLSDAVEKATDAILTLRQDYEKGREFSREVTEAVREIQKRSTMDLNNPTLREIARALPSYVDLYTKALKLRSDQVYEYSLGMLTMIKLSRPHWKVKV